MACTFHFQYLNYIGVKEVFGVAVRLLACSNDFLATCCLCHSQNGDEPHCDSTEDVCCQGADGKAEPVMRVSACPPPSLGSETSGTIQEETGFKGNDCMARKLNKLAATAQKYPAQLKRFFLL